MIEGSVVGIIDKCTAKVVVVTSRIHRLYKKVVYSKRYFMCNYTNDMDFKIGSRVIISSCRPYSKTKKYRVVSVVL